VNPVSEGPLLIRIPNWLGDLVLSLPVLEAAAARPAVFLGPESFRPIVGPRFPQVRYLGVSRNRRWAPVAEIRRAAPKSALLLTDSLSSALLVRLARVPERIGYAAEARSPLLTRVVPRAGTPRSLSRIREYRVLAEAAGLQVPSDLPRLVALGEENERARALLPGGGPYAVLAPGASYGPAKRWSAERFAEVGDELSGRHRLRPVLVGSREDRGEAAAVVRSSRDPARWTDLTGATDLSALAGLLAGAGLVLSNDSGAMHLAAALGRPTIGLFGSTSPVWTSESAPWVANLYAAYPCSPCYRRSCPIGYGCLRSIEVADVLRAAEGLRLEGTAKVGAG
jgi:heptosyltransferase II